MNILFLHSSSDLYGASKILLLTVRTLRAQGHTIFVALSASGALVDVLKDEAFDIQIVQLGILRRKYFTPAGLINRIRTVWRAYKKLSEFCETENIEIIYSNTSAVLVGGMIARKIGIKHLFHIHEIVTSPRWFALALNKYVGWSSNKIIAVSKAVKHELSKYISDNKIEVVYNGLDYAPFQSGNSTLRKELALDHSNKLVGMIGRVHPWKGQLYFLEIAAAIKTNYPNVKFVMVGDAFPGNEFLYDEIVEQKIRLGLMNDVFDLGFRSDIPNILLGLDILILPSVQPDPFPTIILEGMAAGIAVVATAQGGALEMIENEISGYHIPLDNATEAAETIGKLLKTTMIRKSLGSKAKKRVNKLFSLHQYQSKISQIIKQLN